MERRTRDRDRRTLERSTLSMGLLDPATGSLAPRVRACPPAEAPALAARRPHLVFVFMATLATLGALMILLTVPRSVAAEPASLVPLLGSANGPVAAGEAVPAVRALRQRDPLASLLMLPAPLGQRSVAQRTDDSLAAAVQRGSRPDLEPVSNFRKRSRDVFRNERPVEIMDQEMVLRLRLRAKKRETVSVELRF